MSCWACADAAPLPCSHVLLEMIWDVQGQRDERQGMALDKGLKLDEPGSGLLSNNLSASSSSEYSASESACKNHLFV